MLLLAVAGPLHRVSWEILRRLGEKAIDSLESCLDHSDSLDLSALVCCLSVCLALIVFTCTLGI